MWFMQSKGQTLQAFDVNSADGLTLQEAKTRLENYGKNKLKEKPKKSILELFIEQIKNMLIYALFAAAAISCFVGEYVDAIIIIGVVFINAAIGVFQQYKSGKAVEALQKLSSPLAVVRRDGSIFEIRSEELVPGDIVIFDAGRYIPADLRIITSFNLQVNESSLTGESAPANKNADDLFDDPQTSLGDLSNMAFMSTVVTYGRGEGVVIGTGMNTEIGKIAKSLDEDVEKTTPLQKRLDKLGRTLGTLATCICVIIFAISVFQGRDNFDMFMTAVSLAVAAIPESLPAIVAFILAVGITRMSKINAIVKRLPAVETLGSVNIICTDKTGTLTQNKMSVRKIYTMDNLKDITGNEDNLIAGHDESLLVKSFVLCSDASFENADGSGDPTEIALILLGNKFNLKQEELNAIHTRIDEKPFDSDRKLMSTLNRLDEGYRVHTKGALENLLKISASALVNGQIIPLTEELKQKYLRASEPMMSEDALRILGAAYKDVPVKIPPSDMESELIFLGIAGISDPPRLEVKGSIAKAKQAGITSVMITGDHKNTAIAIAKEIGIAESNDQSITGAEIDQLAEDELTASISRYRVFARVSPEHKVKIIRAFKAGGNIVSMTGDGVNDAPSLKFADVGVAMGITGTDVSKEACDIILTDDNFATIVQAIEEGRNIYNNIKKSVIFLLSCNFGEVMAIFLAILFFWPIPLLPTQILWVNLITDSLPAIALGIDTPDKDVMKKNPRDPKDSFFSHGAGPRIILTGILIGLSTLYAFYLGLTGFGYIIGSSDISGDNLTHARTMAFVVLASSQLFYALSVRHEEKTIFRIGLLSNIYLIGAIVIGLLLQAAVISIPVLSDAFKVNSLNSETWAFALGLSAIPLIVNELVKMIVNVFKKHITNHKTRTSLE